MSGTKKFTLKEIASHKTRQSLYVTIHGKVYDVTKFIDEHPGGEEVILEEAGKDATGAFDDVGHSDEAHEILKGFYIGDLKDAPPSMTPKQHPTPTTPKAPQAESSR
ncbi:6509_t:CDS:2 [Ambispora gerdemannii]|uniref:6509_t:CDS:1 n=1 Tax=Ambispora gerdemannii TaxID=144530 RepID=A0A9N8W9B7_9GLOM|nr:6509_t:CDS:2 [Ambispora gerdemannii]